jgi:DhnA family fructose-bisphosphate aldolase class Ia
MSYLGKQVRLRRLLNRKSGRLLNITLDHPIARGVLPGIERVADTLDLVASATPDAVTIQKGIAQNCFKKHAGDVSIILKCSSFSFYQPTYDAWVTSIEEAVRLGADAASMGLIVGDDRQDEAMESFGMFVRDAESYGMPIVTHIYPRGNLIPEEDQKSVERVAYAARVGAELGADIVKTTYTGSADSFRIVVDACPVRVVAAGGLSASSVREYLEQTRQVMDAGAAGVAYGRFVWQHEDPVALIQALKLIIHEDGTVEKAFQVFEENRKTNKG